MSLTREYRETVVERVRKDPEFTAALYSEAISSMIEGDKNTALSILRDLVHAHITFGKLAAQTGLDEKSLHRMLGANGNPTMENLTQLIHVIEQDLKLDVNVSVRTRCKSSRKSHHRPAVLAYA